MAQPTKNTPAQTGELSEAWAIFAQKLAAVLAKLKDDEFMCLSVKGSDRYVRFSLEWAFGMRVETTSNTFLGEQEQLDEQQNARLIAAGWGAPTWTPDDPIQDFLMNDVVIPDDDTDLCPNYFIDLISPVSFDTVASLAVRTFAETLQVPNPRLLEYFAFDGDEVPIEFPELGLKFEELVEAGDDQVTLSQKLLNAIREEVGNNELAYDGDGDIGVRYGSALVFARLIDDGLYISIFSVILSDVPETPAIYPRLNDINSNETLMRVFFRNGCIYGVADIPAVPFVGAHVADVFGYVCDAVDHISTLLQKEFGGRAMFDEYMQSSMMH